MKRNLTILAVLLVLSIAALGVSYGGWTQNLTIDGSVQTGTLDAQFATLALPSDYYATFTGSEVASDGHTLTINLQNVYPGFSKTFTFDVMNKGSIPVNVEAVTVTNNQTWLTTTVAGCPAAQLEVNGKETCSLTVAVADSNDVPMNNSATLTGSLTAKQFNQ